MRGLGGIRRWSIRTRLLLVFVGILVPYLALAGIGLVGIRALWYQVQSIQHEVVAEIDASADLQVAVVQLAMPANDYLITGEPREREKFERRLARVREILARTATAFGDPEERRLLEAVRDQVARMEALSQEILALPNPRADTSAPLKMKALDQLGDDATALLTRIHEVAHREVEQDLQRGIGVIRWVTAAWLFAVLLSVAGGVALGLLFATWISSPVRAIAEGSRRIAEGDLSERVEVSAGGELGETARAFNEMAERMEASYAALEHRTRELAALVKANQAIAVTESVNQHGRVQPVGGITHISLVRSPLGSLIE